MKRRIQFLVALTIAVLALYGCSADPKESSGANTAEGSASYLQVSAEEAKSMMDAQEDYVVLDVRTLEEYLQGHIPGAVLIPHDAIREQAEDKLPDKDQLILVYCRSGNRSMQASANLVDLGYTNVVEFGGINDWPYETE